MPTLRWIRAPGLPPVPMIVTRRLPGRLIGFSGGWFIVVRSDWAGDAPTIVHELEHCRQFWRGGLVVHYLRYLLARRYRLRCELAAYAAELEHCSVAQRRTRLDDAARALATGYRLGLDTAACRRLLVDHVISAAPAVPLNESFR